MQWKEYRKYTIMKKQIRVTDQSSVMGVALLINAFPMFYFGMGILLSYH